MVGKDINTGIFTNVASLNGALVVSGESVVPEGSTFAESEEFNTISADATDDTTFAITSGSTLTIRVFQVACSPVQNDKYIQVTLFDDPNGDATGMTQVRVIFCNSDTLNSISLDEDFVGDGTAGIRIRSVQVAGIDMDVDRRWTGFETP